MICTEERGFIWDQSERPFVRQDSECICEQIHVSVLAFFCCCFHVTEEVRPLKAWSQTVVTSGCKDPGVKGHRLEQVEFFKFPSESVLDCERVWIILVCLRPFEASGGFDPADPCRMKMTERLTAQQDVLTALGRFFKNELEPVSSGTSEHKTNDQSRTKFI